MESAAKFVCLEQARGEATILGELFYDAAKKREKEKGGERGEKKGGGDKQTNSVSWFSFSFSTRWETIIRVARQLTP